MKLDEQWECRILFGTKTEGTYRGGEGTTPETTACPQTGKVKVRQKKKNENKGIIAVRVLLYIVFYYYTRYNRYVKRKNVHTISGTRYVPGIR